MQMFLKSAALLLLTAAPCLSQSPDLTDNIPATGVAAALVYWTTGALAGGSLRTGGAAAAPGRTMTVKFDGEKLTVRAKRIRLGELLALVTEKTSVAFEMPDGFGEIALDSVHAGPSGFREAISSLLERQGINYVIVGQEPVERVLLLSRAEKAPAVEAKAAATPEAQESEDEFLDDEQKAEKTEERLVKEALAAEQAAREGAAARSKQESSPPEKTIEPAENGEPRDYQSGLSESEARMTPEELYRHWQKAREEQQRKLREAQQAAQGSSPH